MISVREAKHIIQQNVPPVKVASIALDKVCGLVLATDIYAAHDMPHFRQSAMDGYAFAYEEGMGNELEIVGEIAAGSDVFPVVNKGQAVRIFTGAPVPDECDTVVIQEKTAVSASALYIKDEEIVAGSNVRDKGAEIKAGTLALTKGTKLTPAAVGFLASLGYAYIDVYTPPVISIIITGNELQLPGEQLAIGQVYESNSFTLRAALQEVYPLDIKLLYASDKMHAVQNALAQAFHDSDIILLTGGVSVGDYDFVAAALERMEVKKLFHRVKQKPGKPLFFGKKEDKLVFGLPGNPSSVLTCFYEYVLPAIKQVLYNKPVAVESKKMILTDTITKKSGLTHFLKGVCNGNAVTPLSAQESFRMSSFAIANCLVCLDEASTVIAAGSEVEVHLLP